MKDLGGGAVLDLGIYMLQLVQFIYKEPPTDIVCTGHISKAGVDESISCALKYKDGRTATLSAHTRANMTNRAEIIGTKGSIAVSIILFPVSFTFQLISLLSYQTASITWVQVLNHILFIVCLSFF